MDFQSISESIKPKWYHQGKYISWEIYGQTWFITLNFGRIEIQLNRWGTDQD